MDDIDLLYTIGCSFTRNVSHNTIGTTLTPLLSLENQWPHLLAEKLNVPVINDALWGGSNHRTFRVLKDFLEIRNRAEASRTLVIVQMTFPARFEMTNYGLPVPDYSWPECDYQEDWIRLNPSHMDMKLMKSDRTMEFMDLPEGTQPQLLRTVSIPRKKSEDNQIIFKDGLEKVYGKLIRYNEETEKLEESMHLYAIKGLLDSYNVNSVIIYGDKPYDQILDNKKTVPEIMDIRSVRELSEGHQTLDNYHPDQEGNHQVANAIYERLTDHTDK